MNLQPRLENDLIILRPLVETDFESLFEIAKDPVVWEQHPCSDRYKIEIYSEFFKDSIKSKGAFIIIDKEDLKVIGSTRFKKIDTTENAIEIGWSFLSRNKWGGKYNKAMKELMIDYAFEFVENILFYVAKDNIRSQKAVQKIGGIRITESHLEHFIKENEWTYRITRKIWKRK